MRPRVLFVVLLAGSAWLFLTDGGRRRRDQVRSLLGGSRSGWDPSDIAPAEPLPFPQSSVRDAVRETTAQPESPDAADVIVPGTADSVAAADSVPAAVEIIPATQVPAPSPAAAVASLSEVAPAPPVDEQEASAPPITVSTQQAGETSDEQTSDEGDNSEGHSPQEQASDQGEGSAEGAPKLTEVLQELQAEIESHAIGQQPDVMVEEILDPSTLQEIGIAAAPADVDAKPVSEEDTPSGPWIGNKRTMKAHPPGSTAHLPAAENRVEFASREEVEQAGYTIVER